MKSSRGNSVQFACKECVGTNWPGKGEHEIPGVVSSADRLRDVMRRCPLGLP